MLSFFLLMLLSGLLWLGVGFFLLAKGLGLLVLASQIPSVSPSLVNFFSSFLGSREMGVVGLIAGSMIVGGLKGRMVLGKTAKKVIAKARALKEPIPITTVFGLKYLVLIGLMMGLGIFLKYLHLPSEVMGCIDVAIGTALIQGSIFYLRGSTQRAHL